MPKKIALILLGCWQGAFAFCGLSGSSASYDFYARNKHLGQVKQVITVDKDHYAINTKTDVGFFFLTDHIREGIKGEVTSIGFQPLSYQMNEVAKHTRQSWRFFPERKLIEGSINKHRFKLKSNQWPVYDTTSYQLALRCALRSESFQHTSYRVFSNGAIKHYHAKLIAHDHVIQTRLGKVKTDQVQVQITPGTHIALLWFAPKWDYLLVQSSLFLGKDGSFFTSINKRTNK